MEKAVQRQNTFYCEILIQNLHSKAVLILGSQVSAQCLLY